MSQFPIIKWINVDGRGVPFAYPQHEKLDGSFTETGEKNPLPTKDVDLKTELELIKAQQKQILERLDSPLDTQLTGSNIEKRLEKIYLHDSVSLADGSRVVGEYTDVSKYKELFMFSYSSLDVDVKLVIRGPRFEAIWLEDEWKTITEDVIIPPRQVALSTHPIVKKQLEGREEIRVDITPVDVPTSGSISIWVVGVPN